MDFSILDDYYVWGNIAMGTSDDEVYLGCETVPCSSLPTPDTRQYADCSSMSCLSHYGCLSHDTICSCLAVQGVTSDRNPGYIAGGRYAAESAKPLSMHDNLDLASPNMYHLESTPLVQLPLFDLLFDSHHSPSLGGSLDEAAKNNLRLPKKVIPYVDNQRLTGCTTPDASVSVRPSPRRKGRQKSNRKYVKYLRESARKERSRQFATVDTVKAYCARRDLLFKVIQCETENRWLESFLPVNNRMEY